MARFRANTRRLNVDGSSSPPSSGYWEGDCVSRKLLMVSLILTFILLRIVVAASRRYTMMSIFCSVLLLLIQSRPNTMCKSFSISNHKPPSWYSLFSDDDLTLVRLF